VLLYKRPIENIALHNIPELSETTSVSSKITTKVVVFRNPSHIFVIRYSIKTKNADSR